MKYGEIWWFNQWNMVIYAGLWWFMVVYGGSYLNIYLTWFLIPHEFPHFVLVLSSTIQTFPVSDQVRSWRDRSKCPSAQHQVTEGWRCHDATEGPGEFPAFLFWQLERGWESFFSWILWETMSSGPCFLKKSPVSGMPEVGGPRCDVCWLRFYKPHEPTNIIWL